MVHRLVTLHRALHAKDAVEHRPATNLRNIDIYDVIKPERIFRSIDHLSFNGVTGELHLHGARVQSRDDAPIPRLGRRIVADLIPINT
jgi:hypothetical protein